MNLNDRLSQLRERIYVEPIKEFPPVIIGDQQLEPSEGLGRCNDCGGGRTLADYVLHKTNGRGHSLAMHKKTKPVTVTQPFWDARHGMVFGGVQELMSLEGDLVVASRYYGAETFNPEPRGLRDSDLSGKDEDLIGLRPWLRVPVKTYDEVRKMRWEVLKRRSPTAMWAQHRGGPDVPW